MSSQDQQEISALIDRMLASLCWSPDQAPDWDAFQSVFHEDARLYPSARPVNPSEIGAFVERMTAQRDNGSLVHFDELKLKDTIHVFGNVAIAFSAYQSTINQSSVSKGLNALLLVKEDGAWRCVGMAWENDTADHPLPPEYTSNQ